MVELKHLDVVEWLLNNGATPEIRPNQPANLIALAIGTPLKSWEWTRQAFLDEWRDLPDETPEASAMRWQNIVKGALQKADAKIVEMIELLARHNIKCDPLTLEEEERQRQELGLEKEDGDMSVDMVEKDPFEALAARSLDIEQLHTTSQMCTTLLNLGASASPTLSRWSEQDPMTEAVLEVINWLEQCQALETQKTIARHVGDVRPPSSSRKM